MRYNRSVGIVYQTIELFVAVVMLMIAGWRASRRERGIEGGREDWGGQEAREREGRGASERLVVVKTLSSWLEGRYCGI